MPGKLKIFTNQMLFFIFYKGKYTPIPVGEWKGIREGCVCSDGKTVSSIECAFNSKCKHTSEIPPIKEMKWEGFNFCAQKQIHRTRCSPSSFN